jgi:hypothetical protein
MPPPKDAKKTSASPGKKGKGGGKKAIDGAELTKQQQAFNPEDRDIYQEPIKRIVRPSNQVRNTWVDMKVETLSYQG